MNNSVNTALRPEPQTRHVANTFSPGAKDSVRRIVSEWTMCWRKEYLASKKPEGGDYDSPECLYWGNRHQALSEKLKHTPISTKDDAKAMLEFIRISFGADDVEQGYIQADTWAFDALEEWAASLN